MIIRLLSRTLFLSSTPALLPWLSMQTDFYNHIIRAIDIPSGAVRTLGGRQGISAPFADGAGSVATFGGPHGIALDSSGALALVVSSTHRDAWKQGSLRSV
jgi:hypothetical protein